ncbi:MAG: hypothetical protein ABI760_04565 [Ferruginibacter sp.]
MQVFLTGVPEMIAQSENAGHGILNGQGHSLDNDQSRLTGKYKGRLEIDLCS